jgi:hypothetical protein
MTDGQVVLLIAGARLAALTLRAWADALDDEADRYERARALAAES